MLRFLLAHTPKNIQYSTRLSVMKNTDVLIQTHSSSFSFLCLVNVASESISISNCGCKTQIWACGIYFLFIFL